MNKIKQIQKSFIEVFSQFTYIVYALIASVFFLFFTVIISNWQTLTFAFGTPSIKFSSKMNIFWSSFGSLVSNNTTVGFILTVFVIILTGINISFLVYYFKNRFQQQKTAGIGILGMVSGVLGVGCSSCGSVILSSVIGLSGAVTVSNVLPLHGLEFSLLSILLLMISILILGDKISSPSTCAITK